MNVIRTADILYDVEKSLLRAVKLFKLDERVRDTDTLVDRAIDFIHHDHGATVVQLYMGLIVAMASSDHSNAVDNIARVVVCVTIDPEIADRFMVTVMDDDRVTLSELLDKTLALLDSYVYFAPSCH